ncbi:MAG: MerR family transcriptional regulator [Clostridia bacterium]|nr:MerR family transcriptional regulator [Clostridia bacterium]
MKIKQVCALTGLTPKAVRFYTEKGLLPRTEEKAYGRTLREYTADDVRTLQDIVTLRESGFSVQEILTMQQSPAAVEPLAQARARALQEELDIGRTALQRLNTETGRTGDWHNLARHLRPTGASPKAEPDFSRLEDEEEGVLLQLAKDTPKHTIRNVCFILVLLTLAAVFFHLMSYDAHQKEPLSLIFSESEVQFTKINNDRVTMVHKDQYPSMTGLFEEPQEIFAGGVETDMLFKNTTYCCVTLQIEIPRYLAEDYRLLDENGYPSLEKYLEFTKKHNRFSWIELVDIHAG